MSSCQVVEQRPTVGKASMPIAGRPARAQGSDNSLGSESLGPEGPALLKRTSVAVGLPFESAPGFSHARLVGRDRQYEHSRIVTTGLVDVLGLEVAICGDLSQL
jgi:hypothetical protein